MRFQAEHRFDAPPQQVGALLVDPDFYLALRLPDLGTPQVLEQRRAGPGGEGLLRLRYEFTGSLDPIAQRLLLGARLTWIQELRLDASGTAGSLRFGAERDPDRLHGDATFTLVERSCQEAIATVRHLDGTLVVALPLIGGSAERRILPGVIARMDIEAAALNLRLAAC